MYLYNDIKEKAKDGDEIQTVVNSHPCVRTVVVKGDGVQCKNEWFHWNFFFEVNHPVGKEIENLYKIN
jgi:hypothetical protein